MDIRDFFKLYSSLTEAPIDNFELIGDFNKGSSFRKEQDRKLLSNPKAVQKIKTKWQNVEQHFNLYFINSPEAGKHVEVGEVSKEWLEQNMPKTFPFINVRNDAVNILFTNNRATPHEPMTAWMIAHRLGHVLSRYEFRGFNPTRQIPEFTELRNSIFSTMSTILADYKLDIPDNENKFRNTRSGFNQDKILTYFYQYIGTMRSARNKEIRDEFEFTHELLAQFIITGKNTFNPIPRSFKAGREGTFYFRGTTADYDECNQLLNTFANDLDYYFGSLLSAAEGRIFVM